MIAIQPENIRRNASAFRLNMDPGGVQVYYPKPYCTLGGGRLVWHHQPVPEGTRTAEELPDEARVDTGSRLWAIRVAVNALGVKDLVQRITHFQPLLEYDDPANPDCLLMRAILLKWIHAVQAPVTLLHVPLHRYVEGVADASAVQARLGELARDAGVRLVDPLPEILALPAKTRRGFRFAGDIHPASAYHQFLVETLARHLAATSPPRSGLI